MRGDESPDSAPNGGHAEIAAYLMEYIADTDKIAKAHESAGWADRVRGYCDEVVFMITLTLAAEKADADGQDDVAALFYKGADTACASPFMPDTSDQLAEVN